VSGGPELFPGLYLGPRPVLWCADGAVTGRPVLQPEVFPDLYQTLCPEILTSRTTVANPHPLVYPATTQYVLRRWKRVFQSAIVAYN
jgi:hypothetical protein